MHDVGIIRVGQSSVKKGGVSRCEQYPYKGIPGRPWFKHMLYGARYTYAHLELPGLTEAVEAKNWPVAQQQLDRLLGAVLRNAELLQRTSALLGGEPNRRR
jgi:transferrin receptor-like protein